MNKVLLLLLVAAIIPVAVAFKRMPANASDGVPSFGRVPARAALPPEPTGLVATPEQLARGRQVYEMLCQACHMPDGRGMGNALPPLAGADYMLVDRDRAARTVLHGLTGPITVNGVGFNAAMPALGSMLTDQQVADVLTYVFNSWGNTGDAFTAARIRALR